MIGSALESEASAEIEPDFECAFTEVGALLDGPGAQPPSEFDVAVLLTASLPRGGRSGAVERIVHQLRAEAPDLKVLVLVGESDAQSASSALAAGAWDVVRQGRPGQLGDRLRALAAPVSFDGAETPPLAAPRSTGWQEMIGASEAIRQVFAMIRRVAATDVPLLISGESGTGKELVALAIHERSPRTLGPFVPINCGAIPESLLESELFGHERGAFTGAHRSTRGRLESAHRGTLLLDEIGEMAPPLQVKLLRFLEDHMVERVGHDRRSLVDVRVIAATNRNLADRVTFREDLYYRLAVVEIQLPALRDRAEDVLLMARVFLQRYATQAGRNLRGFSPDAIEALWKWHWPGNVRELINRTRRAVVMAEGPLVTASDLGFARHEGEAPLTTLREAHIRCEIDCLRRALQRTQGNRSEAARLLGVSRSTLYELLSRNQLD